MKTWETNVRKVTPYTPGEQPDEPNMTKLNTNENPYPPSPQVLSMIEQLDGDGMRRYPDPAAGDLVQAIASYYHLDKEQVFVGVGSDDVLAVAFMTFFNSERPILFPDITYSFYDVWAGLFSIPYVRPKLDDNFCIVKEDYYRENGGIIFPNPNAPTGTLLPLQDIEDILKANPDVVVIVDEAYIDFGGQSALPLIERYDNLLVVQTFSKSRSMAGMRIGYGMGNPRLIQYLNDVKYSYNSYTMNNPSIVLGQVAVRDEVYFQEILGKIIKTREWTKKQLADLGFQFDDSKANFIFAKHERYLAEDIYHAMRKEHIYVRYFKKERIDNYLRITIGTQEEMEVLIDFLIRYLR
jgi:histidinol-phosphate aminotransferase